MSAFYSFLNKAKDTAVALKNKSGSLIEGTKLNLAVAREEDLIEKDYIEIGKKTYANFNSGQIDNPEYSKIFEEIDSDEAKLRLLKRQIADIKRV